MSVNLPSHYVQQFATNIQLKLQQEGSTLRPHVMSGTHIGKQASPVDQVAAVAMQPVTGRFQAMGRVDAAVDRRWVFPSDFDLPQLIDSFDKLRLLTDPQSVYVQNAVNAAGRQLDDLIIAAFSSTAAKTGETGATSTDFTSGNIIAVNYGASANVGLTVAKLRAGKKLLMRNQVNLKTDQIICVVNAETHDDLLGEAQVISLDYNERPVLQDGIIKRFLGIDFVYSERLLSAASTDDTIVPLYAKSGMYLGVWNDMATKISQRDDLQGLPWQAYVYMTAGATRLEETKCVQLLCEQA